MREERVLDDLVGRETAPDDVQLQDFRQFLLIGQQGVEVVLAEAPERLVRRREQGELAGAGDALHEVRGKVFHDAIELVQDAVALLLRKAPIDR